MPSERTPVVIDGREVLLSNLDKVLYPAVGFTKAHVIDYYAKIAPALLPHLAGRPVTLKRYPNGPAGQFFYQKECPAHRPEWMTVLPVWSGKNRRNTHYCLVDDLPGLIWAANLASLELHTSLSCAPDLDRPTLLVFDLDPGPPADIVDCARVGLLVKEILTASGLESFPKTSGSKGLQIYVPLNSPADYPATKGYARSLARTLEAEHPGAVTSNMRKALRPGKVFIDWSQNDEHKTTVSVYSLRAREQPTVSTPVTWDEVLNAARRRDTTGLTFTAADAVERSSRLGDLFAPVLTLKQTLPVNHKSCARS